MFAHEVLPVFCALDPFVQALVIVCVAGLIAFGAYILYRMWMDS